MNTNRNTVRVYVRYALKHWWYVLGIFLFLPTALLTHQIIPPLIASNVLDRLSAGDFDKGDLWGSFGPDLVLFAFLALLGGTIIWRVVIFFTWKHNTLVHRDLFQSYFNKLMKLDSDFHANSFGGSLVSRANKFVYSYYRLANALYFHIYSLTVVFISSSIILWSTVSWYVGVMFMISVVFIAIVALTTKKIRDLRAKEAIIENRQTGYLADMITNVMAVKSFARDAYEQRRFNRATDNTFNASMKVMWASLKREMMFGLVTTGLDVMALVLAALAVVVYDANIATVFLMYIYTRAITMRLWDLAQSGLFEINRGLGDAYEGSETFMREIKVKDVEDPDSFSATDGKILFDKVIFNFDDENQTQKLFNKLHLEIEPGEKIGLVGPSGGGKTTITKLLLRYMDINGGVISIDGQDISKITQNDLRRSISYVPQEPLLFHRSIFENISYGNPKATKEQVIKASRDANAHEFVDKLKDGYDTLVGERGIKLSGGQRQRIAIARAMLKDAPILVLDEATSALDSESEVLIQQALWRLMENRTSIVIAHRLSTIQKMDRIVVLKEGKVVEEGNHTNLIKKKDGLYARLWNHQSGGFLK